MRKIQLLPCNIGKRYSDQAENAIRAYYGLPMQEKHDSRACNASADVEGNGVSISVKTSHFTLVSGTLCEGKTSKADLLEVYERIDQAQKVAYVTAAWTCYEMSKQEFRSFMEVFGTVERDSQKNGGRAKLRALRETARMLEWLEERAQRRVTRKAPAFRGNAAARSQARADPTRRRESLKPARRNYVSIQASASANGEQGYPAPPCRTLQRGRRTERKAEGRMDPAGGCLLQAQDRRGRRGVAR